MNDFKSYSANNGSNGGKTQPKTPPAGNAHPSVPPAGSADSAVEMAKIIAAAMNGKSTAQVMHTIVSEAERGKREGRLTNNDLDNFYNAVYPILDGAKRRKLKEIIAKLKAI